MVDFYFSGLDTNSILLKQMHQIFLTGLIVEILLHLITMSTVFLIVFWQLKAELSATTKIA